MEWFWAGMATGAIATGVLMDVRWRSRGRIEPTTSWRLAGLKDPVLAVRDLEGVSVPAGARVVAMGRVDAEAQASCSVRRVAAVPAEYALDADRRHALLFVGGAREGALALLATDPGLVRRLDREWRQLWDAGEPYAEQHPVAGLAGRAGMVETSGRVQDVVPYQQRYLLRLEDAGVVVGVLVERDPAALAGERIQVRGRLVKDARGYTAIEATDIRRIR